MSRKKTLDGLSRNLFISGLIIGKFNKSKIPLIGCSCFFFSALLYFAGYCAWKASVDEVNFTKKNLTQEFKQQFEREYLHMPQYIYAAILGIAASALLITSFFIFTAPLVLLSTWFFFASNECWWWAESINIKRLRNEKPMSDILKATEHYYNYTILTTLSSGITAISLSLYALLPILAVPLGLIVSIHLLALNIYSFESAVKSTYAMSQLKDTKDLPLMDKIDTYHKLTARTDFQMNHDNKDPTITELSTPTIIPRPSMPIINQPKHSFSIKM